ncbi:hypothetical protein IEE83_09555 [Dyadobacter sp. UP-52]|uniref:Uncharacterized protein n=1 Tax=Dyadobacter subterraneus TaxID=2773304 RepID=A0ABR9W9J4_9BACT|nr:hypothetical protein [Dyadobacter subterraneus]MBE9462125.1 hypothetical protein [Dyadobacter subterraneus]
MIHIIGAYSVFRFSAGPCRPFPGASRAALPAGPTASDDIDQSGCCRRRMLRISQIPVRESKKKNMLKIKWNPNPIDLSTPPQLQGTRSNIFKSTRPMYVVKTSIIHADRYSPKMRTGGLNNRPTDKSSAEGISHSSSGTDQRGTVWFSSSLSNVPRSVSFAIAV